MRTTSKREQGQALMAVIMAVSLVLLSLMTALTIVDFSRQLVARQLTYEGQALNAAQAGLTEGWNWFRLQATQPVVTFAPVQNLAAIPPLDETDDPAIGLVRDYAISGAMNVWGRYEIQRSGGSSNTKDISPQKGISAAGTAWQLEATGYVYVKNSSSAAYNVLPNKVLAKKVLRMEIQRLAVNPPPGLALSVNRSDAINLQNVNVRILGNTHSPIGWVNLPASGTATGTGWTSPSNPPNSQVPGGGASGCGAIPCLISSAPLAGYPDKFSIPAVFGVTRQQLLTMADIVVTSVGALPPNPFPQKLIVLNNPGANFVFQQTTPACLAANPPCRNMSGGGILVILGNVNIQANSYSTYSGLVYVQGSFTQAAPSNIIGAVVIDDQVVPPAAASGVTLSGAGENSLISYNRSVIDNIAATIGTYRQLRKPYECPPNGSGGCIQT
jgi:hypothetical protein